MSPALIKKIIREYTERSTSVAKVLGGGKLRILLSMLYCTVKYGARPIDYERFEFRRKSAFERNRYMTFLRYFKIAKKIDRKTFAEISGNKKHELEIFSDFVNRSWLYIDKDTPEDDIINFITSHPSLIAKPEHGEQGHGIFKIKSEDDINILFTERKTNPFILEEVVENAGYIKEINPTSLNTIRAYTLITGKGETVILGILLRVGAKGATVDNWGSGGVGYNFDLETGICCQKGTDKKCGRHIFHPGSGKLMLGFKIDHFSELKEYIIKLSKVIPSARFVGWDIAITPSGFELIEMNCPGGHDFLQCHGEPYYDIIIKNW